MGTSDMIAWPRRPHQMTRSEVVPAKRKEDERHGHEKSPNVRTANSVKHQDGGPSTPTRGIQQHATEGVRQFSSSAPPSSPR